MKYTPFEIKKMLNDMVVLVDTREHPGKKFNSRVADFGCPWERCKLDFGDYSCKTVDVKGNEVSMTDRVAIERKMDANELALCLGRERKRFEAEFERAKKAGATIYLLIEEEDWGSIYSGRYGSIPKYRSKMNPKSLVASILSWQARYKMNVQFCDEEMTGRLIADILKYELREVLENAE